MLAIQFACVAAVCGAVGGIAGVFVASLFLLDPANDGEGQILAWLMALFTGGPLGFLAGLIVAVFVIRAFAAVLHKSNFGQTINKPSDSVQ
jgi:hypothetical protein